jgi:hypothetical protein
MSALALVISQVVQLGVVHRTVLPSDTDPSIAQCAQWDECPDRGHEVYRFNGIAYDHWWIPPKLLVILRAHCSDAAPTCPQIYDIDYDAVARTALDQSYRAVIILDYPNLNPVGFACSGGGASCAGNLRNEIAFGTATSSKSTVSAHPQDAIVPRLKSLLGYLQTAYPSEGWDRWMTQDAIDWGDVTLAGHSGYAAYIATRREVSRVVMFAEPADDDATWVGTGSSTPIDRFWGFVHLQDEITPQLYQRVIDNWTILGVLGTQRLTTNSACGAGCKPHIKIVEDEAEYADEWRQLLGWGD